MLTVPALIFLGLPPTVANGTNRVALLAQNIGGVWGFNHECMESDLTAPSTTDSDLPGAGFYYLVSASDSCGESLRFHATGYIPDCPKCGHTVYHRKTINEELARDD